MLSTDIYRDAVKTGHRSFFLMRFQCDCLCRRVRPNFPSAPRHFFPGLQEDNINTGNFNKNTAFFLRYMTNML